MELCDNQHQEKVNISILDFPEPLHKVLSILVFGENANDFDIRTPLGEEELITINEFLASIEKRRLAVGRAGRRNFVKSSFSKNVRKLYKVSK